MQICQICQKSYKCLSQHLGHSHKDISDFEYEEKFGEKPLNSVHHIKDRSKWIQKLKINVKEANKWKKGKTLEEIKGKEKSDIIRKKMSLSAISSAKNFPNRGMAGKFHTEETKNKIKEITIQQIINQDIKTISKNQLKLFNELKKTENCEIEFREGYYSIDIAIPNKKIAIEVDGDFWHAHWILEESKLYPIQKKNKNNDIKKQLFLIEKGWIIIRIWDSTLNEDNEFQKSIKIIKQHINEKKSIFLG